MNKFVLVLIIGAGGFLGTIARFLTANYVARHVSSVFPYGTFFVNIIGCFLIGIVYGLAARDQIISPNWRLFLATGFCGGFTTFSSFAFENFELLQTREFFQFGAYIAASLIVGFASAFIGVFLTRIV